jgi:hypothetical protein
LAASAWRVLADSPRYKQWQFDVFLRRGARQQVEALENKAQVAPAQARALVA